MKLKTSAFHHPKGKKKFRFSNNGHQSGTESKSKLNSSLLKNDEQLRYTETLNKKAFKHQDFSVKCQGKQGRQCNSFVHDGLSGKRLLSNRKEHITKYLPGPGQEAEKCKAS